MLGFTKISVFSILILMLIPAQVFSIDPLKEVENSAALKELKRRSHQEYSNARPGQFMDPKSNFAQVFQGNNGDLLELWVRPRTYEVNPKGCRQTMSEDYVQYQCTYPIRHSDKLKLRVMVPHPRAYTLLEFGLLKDFAAIEPPILKVEETKKQKFRGYDGSIFEHEDGACSLLVKVARHSLVQLYQSPCLDIDGMTDLGNSLDLKRLSRKLES